MRPWRGIPVVTALLLAGCGASQPPVQQVVLALDSASTAFGTVRSTPMGIDCPGTCTATFEPGTVVRLTATDTATAVFDGWQRRGCGEQPHCDVQLRGSAIQVGVAFAAARRANQGAWFGGDTHVHSDHSSDGSLFRQIDQSNPGNVSVGDQIDFAETTGADFLSITDHRTWDQHYHPEWASNTLLLIPGEEANARPHATVQGSVERVLQQQSNELRALQQSIWDAHAQGAAWITAHPDRDATESDGTPLDVANAIGIDAVEMWNIARSSDDNIAYVEGQWNRGYRFGVVAASDNHFRELRAIAGPGAPRTSLQLRGLREADAIAAYRAGHVRMSAGGLGPTVHLEAARLDGAMMLTPHFAFQAGDEISVPAGTPLRLRITVARAVGTQVLVYRNPGRAAGPLASFTPTALVGEETFTLDIASEEANAWYRIELRGPGTPDSPIITVENLLDGLAEGELQSTLAAAASLTGQLRAASSALFVGPAPAEPDALALIPPDTGEADGARLAIGARRAWSGFGDLAVVDGVSHVVAEGRVDGRSSIYYRRLLADGSTALIVDLTPDADGARMPRVAARDTHVWVVWQEERGDQIPRRPEIRARASLDGGRSWEAPVTVRAVDGRAMHPAIALDAAHRPVIAWQEIRAGQPFDVFAQILGVDDDPVNLSAEGKAFQPAGAVDTRSARWPASLYPAVAIADDGQIVVAWQDNRADPDPLFTGRAGRPAGTTPDDWDIGLSRRAGPQAAWEALPGTGVSVQADRFPDLAWDALGRLHLVWEAQDLSPAGTASRVLAAHSVDAGMQWSAAQQIGGSEGFSAQRPRLGVRDDGIVAATWMDASADDWRWRIAQTTFIGPQWRDAEVSSAPGNSSWPVPAANQLVFASTRNARRLQRDSTQQILLRRLE